MDIAVEQLITHYERNRLYGALEIKFENGRVVLIKETTTHKPTSERTSRSGDGKMIGNGTHHKD
jgi:hypothetical protein